MYLSWGVLASKNNTCVVHPLPSLSLSLSPSLSGSYPCPMVFESGFECLAG